MDLSSLKKLIDLRTIARENPRRVLLIGGGIGIAFIALIIVTQIVSETHKKLTQLTQETKYEKERNTLLLHINQLQTEYQEYQRRLPSMVESVWLMNQLADLAGSMNLALSAIQPEKLPPSGKFQETAIRAVIQCSYDQLGQLIEKIENADTFMRIHELTLEKGVTEEVEKDGMMVKVGKGRVEMIIHSFMLKDS